MYNRVIKYLFGEKVNYNQQIDLVNGVVRRGVNRGVS